MVEVKLSPTEIYAGAQAGVLRQVQNLTSDGSKPTRGLENNASDWQLHIEGVLAEQAVAKHLNVYFSGKGQRGDKDVGDYEVRTTDRANGRLLIRQTDSDDSFYLLCTGLNGTYQIHGGIHGRDAKQDKYWDASLPRPCWAVPQSDLRFKEER